MIRRRFGFKVTLTSPDNLDRFTGVMSWLEETVGRRNLSWRVQIYHNFAISSGPLFRCEFRFKKDAVMFALKYA